MINFAAVAGFIAILAFVPYIVAILRGQTKPVLATWIVFFCLNWLTVIGLENMEDPTARFVPWGFAIGASLTLLLALLRSENKKFSRLDIICLSVASIGLIAMLVTGDGAVALYASLGAFVVGAFPTLVHCIKKPEEEDVLAWTLFGLVAVLNMLHIPNWESFNTAIYPIVIGLIDIPIAAVMLHAKATGRT